MNTKTKKNIGDSFIPQIVFVLLTATSAYLKRPEWFKNH